MLKLTAVLKQLAKHPSVFHDYRRRGHKEQLHRRTLLSPSAGDQSEATIPRGWSPYSLQIRAPGQHLPQNTTVEYFIENGPVEREIGLLFPAHLNYGRPVE